MLEVQDLNLFYGSIHALHDIQFSVSGGEIVTLIGANGAGKTSVLQAISRMLPLKSGTIVFDGKDITHTEAHRLPAMGLSQVPEGRRVFSRMSVLENLEMGAYTRRSKGELEADLQMVFGHFPRLKERVRQLAGTLSGGEQQMLATARALMSHPTLLMMDEPSMGLSPILVEEIFGIIRDINRDGTTILLVEQNAHMALGIANRAYVLETGRIVMEGDAKTLLDNEKVREAYLGT
ncbi:MAG: ABC transporter ATP-binding protein [Candidatus Limiplasma sp.]|nr:ABC transporter ATP-binding protein [Candidatus Limiplasma sp.]